MLLFPNCKINIGLRVVKKRDDGFHNIETIFYPVQWYDCLEAVQSEVLKFESTGISIPGNMEENLVIKAYRLLEKHYTIPPFHFYLLKNIPAGAGLGGGSADAAFALKLINQLSNLNLMDEQLEEYARQLGSDCAFFIKNKPVFASGKGDEFLPVLLDLKDYYIKIIFPGINVNTGQAYKMITPVPADFDLRNIGTLAIEEWKRYLKNDFEAPIFSQFPFLSKIKEKLYDSGAIYAAMSGSGSAVYGIFREKSLMDAMNEDFKDFKIYKGRL